MKNEVYVAYKNNKNTTQRFMFYKYIFEKKIKYTYPIRIVWIVLLLIV